MQFVDLKREFRDLTVDEQSNPTSIRFREWRGHGGIGWDQLLNSRRVVVCAEAGAGKTIELQECRRRLVEQKKYAFYIPIEAICVTAVEQFLAAEVGAFEYALDQFRRWRDSSEETAWFFLDSLDEAKLAKHTLTQALTAMRIALTASAVPRARFVVSSRPDWNPIEDKRVLDKYIPELRTQEASTDDFLRSVREPRSSDETKSSAFPEFRAVALLSMTSKQQRTLAAACEIRDLDEFFSALNQTDVGADERSPQDIIDLSALWKNEKKLGNRREMLEHRVLLRLTERNVSPHYVQDLPHDKAIEGAQRLALALTMGRTRTIFAGAHVSPVVAEGKPVFCEHVLSDWSPQQVRSLLSRSIFLPATYGCVRFDHRSTEEYLAAQYLIRLRRQGGMSNHQLRKMFFDERYGESVVIPSKIPIAAWVALDDSCEAIRSELLRREPEVLVLHGDAASLSLTERERLVRSFVRLYSERNEDNMSLSVEELRRLATRDMTFVVTECLSMPALSKSPLLFLLKVIWLGGLSECADLLRPYCLDVGNDEYVRILAIRAASSCGATALVRDIIESSVTEESLWPAQLIPTVLEECLPTCFTLTAFESLVRRGSSTKKERDRLQSAVEYVCGFAPKAHIFELIEFCCQLITSTKSGQSKWELTSTNAFLINPLAQLCERAFQELQTTESLLVACSIVFQFQQSHSPLDSSVSDTLRQRVANASQDHRRALFWHEFQTSQARKPEADSWSLFTDFDWDSVLRPFVSKDISWIESCAVDASYTNLQREVVLRLWFGLWRQNGESQADLTRLQIAIKDSTTLLAFCSELASPPVSHPNNDWEKTNQARTRRNALAQEKIEKQWVAYRAKVMDAPAEFFAEPKRLATVRSICSWLHGRPRNRDSSLGMDKWGDVRIYFGDDVATLFEGALRALWRTTPRKLRSTLTAGSNRSFDSDLVNALTGLLIESTAEGWATRLTPDESKTAAEWATLEMNTFPSWIDALAGAHKGVVCGVCLSELRYEIDRFAPGEYPQVLSMIKRGPRSILIETASVIYDAVASWKSGLDSTPPHTGTSYASQLLALLEALVQAGFRMHELERICEPRYQASPKSEEGLIWLQCIAATDLSRVAHVLRPVMAAQSDAERREYGRRVIAVLFGRRDYSRMHISLDSNAAVLRELVVLAYELVPPAFDPRHEGTYSPSVHDDAVTGRGVLMSALANTGGELTCQILRELKKDERFRGRSDYLEFFVQQRAANDSEWTSLEGSKFKDWLSRFDAPPRNVDDLFRLVGERLKDIHDELRNHDFSMRPLLADKEEEKHFQLFLADRLHLSECGMYSVVREEEVVDNKKPDIRIAARDFDGRVTIELKVGDRYSVRELEQALTEQLSGKYLRHKRCKAGILLVTYGGRKDFKHPQTKKAMSIEEVDQHLRVKAESLSRATDGEKLIQVFFFDLRGSSSSKA